MSIQIIQQRLLSYNCKTEIEEQQAIREITQEVILAALSRGDFFKHASFQGGTCLRIFYGLNRFSEDMDFILRHPATDFRLKSHLRKLTDELSAYGYDIEISDRNETYSAVKSVFLKDHSLGQVINLRHRNQTGQAAKIRIKLEIDTNPPAGSNYELKYLDFPFVSAVTVQDKPSLLSGKLHALLCRKYVKGRDWYDFIWYTSQNIQINFEFLSSAINQLGPWQNQNIKIDKTWVLTELEKKITSLDWKKTKEDVRRFIRAEEQPSLDIYGGRNCFFGS
ncbi:MAG: nucleotidyl transferase AbiEii/AbiGii toxin family protein [Thermodesulfobacteriota bacterium]|nr:nucleotidyl transferase AbiEii/AbiGii toxin family protein [Thermodesulfobacteriota bacterium]